MYKEEGYCRVQTCGELAHVVLANTAPSGHEIINDSLQKLQEDWNTLAAKMVETKVHYNYFSYFIENYFSDE